MLKFKIEATSISLTVLSMYAALIMLAADVADLSKFQ